MTSPNRQAERTERSTEALLDAAAELIAEGGVAAMTFAALGERSGYSRGLATARFGSKAGLVDALVKRVWRSLRDHQVVPLETGGTGLESLLGLVDGIHDLAVEQPREIRAMAALIFEAPSAGGALGERMAAFSDDMRSEIAAALDRGRGDGSIRADVDPSSAAVLLTASLHGIAYQWLVDPQAVDLDAAYGALRDQVTVSFGA